MTTMSPSFAGAKSLLIASCFLSFGCAPARAADAAPPSLAATIDAMPRGLERAPGPALDAAIDAARAAVGLCMASKVPVSVLIADSAGEPVVLLSGDGAGVRSQLITRTKVAIVVKYGASSDEMFERAKTDPRLKAEAKADPNIGEIRGGALPVMRDGKRIAVVAVSGGSLNGDFTLDTKCALAAVARLQRP